MNNENRNRIQLNLPYADTLDSDETREAFIIAVFGARGTGKTTLIRDDFADPYPRGVLVYDMDDNERWRAYPEMPLDKLSKWKGTGKYRIINTDHAAVFKALHSVKNCMVIFEDAAKYLFYGLNGDLRRFILSTKQKSVDMILTFHFVNPTHAEVFGYLNYIVKFKTGENIKRSAQKIPCFDALLQAQAAIETIDEPVQTKAGNTVSYYLTVRNI